MIPPPHLLIAFLIAAGAVAADQPLAIVDRHGSALIVTANGGRAGDEAFKRMTQRVTVDFAGTPVAEAAETLARLGGVNLVVAPAVRAAGTTVTLKAEGLELGRAFRWLAILARVHVGHMNGAVHVADQAPTSAQVTRTYDVSDLMLPPTNYPGPDLDIPQPGGQGTRLIPPLVAEQPGQSADDIADLVRRVINPAQP